jgi:hypothetical protein
VTPLVTLPGSAGGGAEGAEVAWCPPGAGRFGDPVGDAGDVAGQCGQDVPDVRFRQASVVGSVQAAGADVLGAGGFDAGADRVPASLLINIFELASKTGMLKEHHV